MSPLAEDDLPEFLRHRPRRVPMSAPPADYFDALPARVLTRIREVERVSRPTGSAAERTFPRLAWPRLRLALASATLSAAFVAAFWLARPAALTGSRLSADHALTNVSPTELVEYLADPTTAHLSASDLTALSATDYATDATPLNVSGVELDAALDELLPQEGSVDDSYL